MSSLFDSAGISASLSLLCPAPNTRGRDKKLRVPKILFLELVLYPTQFLMNVEALISATWQSRREIFLYGPEMDGLPFFSLEISP
jgi:hypothetical protein